MKLTLEHYDQIITIETSSALTATDTLRMMIRLCLAASYHHRSMEEAVLNLAEELEEMTNH